jgi:hypothetical protein
MTVDHIRYDILAQDALRDMVRKVLAEVAKSGLKGDHHFNITFATGAPGVRIPARLREQYPQDMTIVLQHQFWDLKVAPDAFEVGLSFGGVPERLIVPFAAITSFVDPSVQFALQFQAIPEAADEPAEAAAPTPEAKAGKSVSKPRRPAQQTQPPTAVPAVPTSTTASPDPVPAAVAAEPASDKPGAEVVRLDRFRKK